MTEAKRRLKGFTIRPKMLRDPADMIHLTPEEGRGLQELLTGNNVPRFVTIKRLETIIETGSIERITPDWEYLEEKCLLCHQFKPKNSRCPRGCDDPRKPLPADLEKRKAGMLKTLKPNA